MADRSAPANSGEESTNAPSSNLPLDSAAEFRTLSRRLEEVANRVDRLQKPPTFRIADAVTVFTVLLAFLVAIFTAWGLKDRIDDLVRAQAGTESRLSAQVNAAEARLATRIDRIDDRVGKIGERTATLEGRRAN